MKKETADYIDPMIGAITEHESTWMGLGKTYPGPWLPSGLVQVGPDTVTSSELRLEMGAYPCRVI